MTTEPAPKTRLPVTMITAVALVVAGLIAWLV
ncbi:MAG: hypothetical protein JWQ81_5526 [Amycolatopsis sp.]|nr:hypothetical protein [Amycolatopsis sp.]